ncbi:MAG: flagellar basal body-associated FliL family protein [Acidimicrobiales bacterium]
MSDTQTDADEGKKGKKGKKEKSGGKSNLLPAIILAVGMCVGGYFMGQGGGGSTAAAGPTTTEAPVLGEIATVEPININLAGGHFLRVGMGLQLIEGVLAADFEKGETAKATDLVIAELGGTDMTEISTAEGREKVKAKLKKHLKEIYEGDVTDVYFTDFVMQ